MKPYHKPMLVRLSLSGNEALCNNCGYSLKDHPDIAEGILGSAAPGKLEGGVEKSDFVGLFGSGEQGCTAEGSENITAFCKFTSISMEGLVAWS